jgi:hypothetical protein
VTQEETALRRLTRDAGPSGSIEQNGIHFAVDGWELFEGDPGSPHMCRGWFRSSYAGFWPKRGDRLRLHLRREDGSERLLNGEIARASSAEPLWEFVAEL